MSSSFSAQMPDCDFCTNVGRDADHDVRPTQLRCFLVTLLGHIQVKNPMSSSKTKRKNNRAFAKDFFNDLEEELGDGHGQRIKEYERPQYGTTEQARNETPDEEEDYGDEDFEVVNVVFYNNPV